MYRVLKNRALLLLPKMSTKNISDTPKLYEKALEELEKNPFYGKYAGKISVMQQFTPEEFKSKIEDLAVKRTETPQRSKKERQNSAVLSQAKPQLIQDVLSKKQGLESVMKMDLLINKTGEEIKHLWLDFHKDKDVIAGVIPEKTYNLLHERGLQFPMFILPVPRSEGYEFILLQFADHEIHFTPLISYQTHKENAPECLKITHYPELAQDKGVVLMKGEYDPNMLNCQEAQCLANELQLYYSQNSGTRMALLKRFTYSPHEFKHMDLIAELETLSI